MLINWWWHLYHLVIWLGTEKPSSALHSSPWCWTCAELSGSVVDFFHLCHLCHSCCARVALGHDAVNWLSHLPMAGAVAVFRDGPCVTMFFILWSSWKSAVMVVQQDNHLQICGWIMMYHDVSWCIPGQPCTPFIMFILEMIGQLMHSKMSVATSAAPGQDLP